MWSVGAMMYMLYWPRHTPSLEYRDLGVIRELTNRLANNVHMTRQAERLSALPRR
jgi:hypothetical protein